LISRVPEANFNAFDYLAVGTLTSDLGVS
jgi:hypothetical protein